jgi:hypothetical protein
MSDHERDPDDIEAILRQAALREPGRGLDARVARDLRRSWYRGMTHRVRLSAVSAAAVAIVSGSVLIVTHLATGPAPTSPVAVHPAPATVAAAQSSPVLRRPVGVVRTFSSLTDEGIIGTSDGAPVQRFRRQSVQQMVLVDPIRGTRVAFTVPREEIFVVRVRPF